MIVKKQITINGNEMQVSFSDSHNRIKLGSKTIAFKANEDAVVGEDMVNVEDWYIRKMFIDTPELRPTLHEIFELFRSEIAAVVITGKSLAQEHKEILFVNPVNLIED
jgi:hypothetical protein